MKTEMNHSQGSGYSATVTRSVLRLEDLKRGIGLFFFYILISCLVFYLFEKMKGKKKKKKRKK